jgi:ADP-heptose:LPS heptosyltransferase
VAVGPTVLALRALGLGDTLTGIPALRGLRRRFPGHRLVLAAPKELGEWLRGRGVVDDVLPAAGLAPLSAPPPDVAVNLHGRGPQSHALLRALAPGDLIAFGEHGAPWREDEHEVHRWCRLVGRCGPEDLRLPTTVTRGDAVVVHPGAAFPSRRWPADRWRAVVAALLADGHRVLVTGGEAERPLGAAVCAPGAIDLTGRLGLDALGDVVAGAAALLCGDTGVAHLATALGTPSVLLFGPVSPARWGPLIDLDRHVVLWHGDGTGDPHGDTVDPALAAVTVGEVLTAFRGLPS